MILKGYTFFERCLVTTFSIIPFVFVIPSFMVSIKNKNWRMLWGGMFAGITSIMYHVLEAWKYEEYKSVFYINDGDWHVLDNIGILIGLSFLLI